MYTNDPTLIALVKKYAPEGFNKRAVKVEATETVHLTGLQWGGGYKNEFVVVNLADGQHAVVPEPHYMAGSSYPSQKLRAGLAAICYSYAGSNKYVTVYLHPDNVTPQLEDKPELSPKELACLVATRSLKNSYGGETELRFKECKRNGSISTWEDWVAIRDGLINKGFLTKSGALTIKGKNAASGH